MRAVKNIFNKTLNRYVFNFILNTNLCCLFFSAIFLFSNSLFAQDKIHKKDSTIILAKVTFVGDSIIKYKTFSNLDGPLHNINKKEIAFIIYQNGEKEIYNYSVDTKNALNPVIKENQTEPQVKSLEDIVAEYSSYFSQTDIKEANHLSFTVTPKYVSATESEKKEILDRITATRKKSVILVHSEAKTELWTYNSSIQSAQLLDTWDLIKPEIVKTTKTVMHPWFVYLGGQLGFTGVPNLNITLNVRVGFFLLLNRWDMSANVNAGLTDNFTSTRGVSANASYLKSATFVNAGIMSRLHFPIRKFGIDPNIGGELSVSVFSGSDTRLRPSLVLGISWFVGFGTLDIGMKLWDEKPAGMGGLNLIPSLNKR